jgi:hypothetical protein
MGVDGIQQLTIYGPKEDIDAIERCKCRLTPDQTKAPYPELEGEYKTMMTSRLKSEARWCHFVYHLHWPEELVEIKRIHERKMVVTHVYRNKGEFSFFFLLLISYPRCCLVNEISADNGYHERLMIRFTPRETIHLTLFNWLLGCMKNKSDNLDTIKNITTSLNHSHVRYRLTIEPAESASGYFSSLGIKAKSQSFGWGYGTDFHFVSKNQPWDPTIYINTLRRKYPECVIHGHMEDLHGHHVEVIYSREGYSFREWKNITKEEERTLDDFSLKE